MQLVTSISQGEPFTGRCDLGLLGAIRVCRILADRHEEGRGSRVSVKETNPFYKLVFQMHGRSHLEQLDKRTVIGNSSWYVYDVSRPYSLMNVEASNQIAILIPKDMCPDRLNTVMRTLPQRAFPMTGTSRILFDCLQSTLSQFDGLSLESGDSLGDSLMELTKLTIMEKMDDGAGVSMRQTVRERIEAHISRHLFDPDLSIDTIAQAMNCTKRYLHKVFNEDGRTLNQYIWDCRLERCRRDLERPELAHKSITEIAFTWGFNNSSHFSRAFKRKFGETPHSCRTKQLAS